MISIIVVIVLNDCVGYYSGGGTVSYRLKIRGGGTPFPRVPLTLTTGHGEDFQMSAEAQWARESF